MALTNSVMTAADPVGLKNIAEATINPATEDTLASIKSTDGVKKITDALPAGTNIIGNVRISDTSTSEYALVSAPGEWSTPIPSGSKAVAVNTLFHFWNPAVGTYPGISGDDNWYAGLMTNEGEFVTAIGAILDGSARQQVAAGAGNVTAGTFRVAIASDDVNAAAIKTALQIMDDWDESDRAKVNIIAGQAGIAGGAGAVGATVPRVTLASDDPLVAFLTKAYTHASNQETSTGTKTVISAPGASTKIILKSISIINNDTLDGSVALQTKDSTGDIVEKIYLPAYGGQWNFTWPGEGRRLATADKALELVITTCDDVTWMVSYTTVAV